MNTATFDTHAAVKALTRAGVATKADIAALETRLTVRMVALGGVIVAVMVALRLFG